MKRFICRLMLRGGCLLTWIVFVISPGFSIEQAMQLKPSKAERKTYVKGNPSLQKAFKMAIEAGTVILNMSPAEVKAVYGEPCSIQTVGDGSDVFLYGYNSKGEYKKGDVCSGSDSFYFKNGKLTHLTELDYKSALKKEEIEKQGGEYQIRRKNYVSAHKNLPKHFREAILKGEVLMGMSLADAEASWGKPKDINRSAGSWGLHEQWVYSLKVYLYFENGKLTSWQD